MNEYEQNNPRRPPAEKAHHARLMRILIGVIGALAGVILIVVAAQMLG